MEQREKQETSKVRIVGRVTKPLMFSHEVYGESFYEAELSVSRKSGTEDLLPVMVSERLIDVNEDYAGKTLRIEGRLTSYNAHGLDGKMHLFIYIFANAVEITEDSAPHENQVVLYGFICKPPVYRKTPFGSEIADVLLAVNRTYGKTSYIPCLCWGRNARYAANFELGAHVKFTYRLQSRVYQKAISETESEERTAYEVSVSKLEVVYEE